MKTFEIERQEAVDAGLGDLVSAWVKHGTVEAEHAEDALRQHLGAERVTVDHQTVLTVDPSASVAGPWRLIEHADQYSISYLVEIEVQTVQAISLKRVERPAQQSLAEIVERAA